MAPVIPLHLKPSLWRTCRVLANTVRLRMLRHLLSFPEQSVSDVTKALKMRRPLASQYLRALNARGLLSVRRSGRWVYYRAVPDETVPQSEMLLNALRQTFAQENDPIDRIFKLVTAFTNPRREQIYRALRGPGLTFKQVRAKTGIPKDALERHLKKLRRRGFVLIENDIYLSAVPDGPLGEILSRLVLAASQ